MWSSMSQDTSKEKTEWKKKIQKEKQIIPVGIIFVSRRVSS